MKQCLLLYFGLMALMANAQRDDLKKALDRIIYQDYMVDHRKMPGFTVGILDGDSSYVFSYGKDCATSDYEVDLSLLAYEMGGATQLMTALYVQKLADEGRLHLDSTANTYLPDSLKTGFGGLVTLRQLLQHTSGLSKLPEDFGLYETSTSNPYGGFNGTDLQAYWLSVGKRRPTGKFEYSHTGYAVLGMVIEAIEKQPFNVLFREQFLPEMPSETPCHHNQDGKAVQPWRVGALYPSLGGSSHVSTLMQVLQWHLQPETNSEWHRAAHHLMTAPTVDATREKSEMSARLGWLLFHPHKNYEVWAATGSTSGNSAFIGMIPATRTAVVILSNSEMGTANMGTTMLRMLNQNWKR